MDLIVGEALELRQAAETTAATILTTHSAVVADTMTTTAVEQEATEVAETAAMETVVAATAVLAVTAVVAVATEAAAEAVDAAAVVEVAVVEATAEEGSTKCDFNSPARFIYLSKHIYSLNFPAVEKASSLVSNFNSLIRNKTQTIICSLT